MRILAVIIANFIWFVSTILGTLRWHCAIWRVAQTQEQVLRRIIAHNSHTMFGHKHDFGIITTAQCYQDRVPVRTYEGYEPYISAIAEGANQVLTSERVTLLEPSSGTTGGKKLIPYTDSLQREFQAGINPWINRLYRTHPKLFLGKAYWSVAPVARREYTKGGLPIGFATDAEYLGWLQQNVLQTIMAVPKEVTSLQCIETFRYVTVLFLLATRNLTLISVWHPSFLTLLLETLEQNIESLISDVRYGRISMNNITHDIQVTLEKILPADMKRADEIERIFLSRVGKEGDWKDEHGKTLYEALWPMLSIVSCWGDAQAWHFFEQIKTCFPNTYCEPKGLIATEGFVSFPIGELGATLSLLSHFYEFKEAGKGFDTDTLLAHELQVGQCYTVILSTSGGLYRYAIGDIVEVLGFQAQCPIIRFLGKQTSTVDMCGEKLTEVEVTKNAHRVFQELSITPNFWMLAPEISLRDTVGYTLFFQNPKYIRLQKNEMRTLANRIDEELGCNFHYAYCRKLNQLKPIRVFMVDPTSNPIKQYLDACQKEGQRLGNIKPRVLHPATHWSTIFEGSYVV